MADRTPFAGLTRLAPGEALGTDGFSFQNENPSVIDQMLEVGAVSHLHDAHAPLANPTDDPVVSSSSGAGSIAAGVPLYVRYTLLDQFGGETLPSSAVQVTTPAPILTPTAGPTLALDNVAGTLGVGTFLYALSLVDAAGGETPLGPASQVQRFAGPANAEVTVSGLAAILAATGATEWRLWRSMGGGRFGWIGQGSSDTYVDNGASLPDCTIFPPTRNTTNANNSLSVTVPNTQPAGTTQFRVYVSLDGSFGSPALAGTYPIASAGVAQVYAALSLADGRPPAVSRALAGAHRISLETEVANNRWREPVANEAALPALGNTNGDMRLVLDSLVLYTWNSSGGGAWQRDSWQRPVANVAALPPTGNQAGEIRVTLDDLTIHGWNGTTWVAVGGGGGGGGVTPLSWTALTSFQAGWSLSVPSWLQAGRWAKDDYGVVHVDGAVQAPSFGWTAEEICTLPVAAKPLKEKYFVAQIFDTSSNWRLVGLEVDTSGALIIRDPFTPTPDESGAGSVVLAFSYPTT